MDVPDSIFSTILDKYGLIGLVVLFAGYVVKRVLDFLMSTSDSKDKTIKEQGERFSAALDGNSKAMNDLNLSVTKLTDASANIVDGFDRLAEQGRQEHERILEHVAKSLTN